MLDEGVYASVSEIGDAENISKSYVSRILRLALLAPDGGLITGGCCAFRRLDRRRRHRHRPVEGMVEAIVRAALAQIEGAVGKGETVNLVGFGRFEVYERGARRGRNLRTGESLKIPATGAVRFRIGKRLRDAAAGSKSKRSGKGKK